MGQIEGHRGQKIGKIYSSRLQVLFGRMAGYLELLPGQ